MNSAMGMVAATVKTPHGLSASAFTTTSASTASKMTRMARIASTAMAPAEEFNSSFTISPSELPLRLMEQNDEDGQNRQHGDGPGGRIQFFLHHFAERFAIAPHGAKQDYKILHRAAEDAANQNPQ